MINKVILMGRLTADPELRQTTSGISSCRFSVAVDRGYKSKETGERQADFINVIAWRQTAEFVSRYFSKGRMIIVEGSLRNNNYTDSNGVKHYSMDVQADNVTFGESKSNSERGNQQPVYQQPYAQQPMQQQYAQQPVMNSAPQNTPVQNSLDIGSIEEYTDIMSDGEVPF